MCSYSLWWWKKFVCIPMFTTSKEIHQNIFDYEYDRNCSMRTNVVYTSAKFIDPLAYVKLSLMSASKRLNITITTCCLVVNEHNGYEGIHIHIRDSTHDKKPHKEEIAREDCNEQDY